LLAHWVEAGLEICPDGESDGAFAAHPGNAGFKKSMALDVHIGWNPDSFGTTGSCPRSTKSQA